jgi:hypothetical protein
LVGNESLCFEADVDDPGVRARGQHSRAAAAHHGGEKALVVDLHVESHLIAVPAVVSGKAGFVSGSARDVAAGEEEVAHGVRVGVSFDSTAGGFDRLEGGFGRQHRDDVEGREDAALVWTVGMYVHDEWSQARLGACCGDGGDDGWDGAGVVPVPVGEEQDFDGGEVDG